MVDSQFSQKVTKVLDELAEVIVTNIKAAKIPVQEVPTEQLITNMQDILNELKTRVTASNTLALHELPVGAKVRDKLSKYYGAPITWLVADHNFYGENQTTLLAERILTFKAFDAAEPNNPDSYRSDYGNNDYEVSNIHQWLNSDKGNWFTPLHEYDQAPTSDYVYRNPYADERGFLDNLSPVLRGYIVDTIVDEIEAQVFLLSSSEVGLSDSGPSLALFENGEFRKAKPTEECVQIDDEGDAIEPDWWWLRTPYAGNSHDARFVNSSGVISDSNAYYGSNGARPALNLSSEIRVKAEPNEEGIYEIVWGTQNV